MSSGESGKAGEGGAQVLNGRGTGWSGKNKVWREKMRQESLTPSMVALQMIPPAFKKLQKNHKMNGVTGFHMKLSSSGCQRDKADRHGEDAADLLVTVTRQPASSVGGRGREALDI